ncbi:MAG: DUF3987 domain-containing protein [Acidimicrobiales bacterium]
MSAQVAGYELPASPGWPCAPHDAAYQGMAGALVAAIAPHTEADPVAVLAQLLIAAGAVVGRGAYALVEATRHHPNEFCVLVGDSAKARKGSSWDHVARLMERAAPGFSRRCATGLSSGEGLVWALRDPDGADPGSSEPPLLVVEPEFASVLKAAGRDVSSLSPVLRSAWDGRPLALLTRNAPARAAAPHISAVGHITAQELRHHVSALEVANGLLNRFCFVACRRARLLPDGGDPDPLEGSGMPERLGEHLQAAGHLGHVRFTTAARAAWRDTYGRLSEPRAGMAGGLLARSEAHVLRLSLIYTLVDGASAIGLEHLGAGLALWEYCQDGVELLFSDATGDPLAEAIGAALIHAPAGMTRTEIRDLLGRNRPGAAIDEALGVLAASGRARPERVTTAGRPAQRWVASRLATPH